MKVLVLYPPICYPISPYSAPFILAGQIKNICDDVNVIDMNVEYLKYILSSQNLKNSLNKICEIYQEKSLSQKHKLYLEKFLLTNQNTLNTIISEANTYYKLMVSNNVDKKEKSKINFALKLAYSPFYPFLVKYKGSYILEKNLENKYNYNDIIRIVSDKEKNPYYSFYEKYLDKIKVKEYDLVVITVPFESNLYPALTLAKMIKDKTTIKVALGGVLITSTIQAYKNHPYMFGSFFDVIITGPGENSLESYIRYLKKEIPISDVQGAVYKENGTIKQNINSNICDINNIKIPLYKQVNFEDYEIPSISLEFSKGCYWGKCSYCYSHTQKKFYIANPKCAVDKIDQLIKETGVTTFSIVDDALSINFVQNFADELIKRKLDINYNIFLRLEKALNYDIFQKLYISGLRSIFFGLESASPRVLEYMNKGVDISDAGRILKDSHDAGIQNGVGFMFGFPTEDENDVLLTIKFQKDNKEYIDQVNNFYFTLLKHSGILNMTDKFKISNIQDPEEFANYLLFEAPRLSVNEINRILSKNDIEGLLSIYTRW